MKIRKIFIKEFIQFKEIEFDLTYPQGHTLEGQPLKKICIIGQSGTGKTRLLDFIAGMSHDDEAFKRKKDYNNYLKKTINRRGAQSESLISQENYIEVINESLLYRQYFRSDVNYGFEIEPLNAGELKLTKQEFAMRDESILSGIVPKLIYVPAEQRFGLGQATLSTFEKQASQKLELSIDPVRLKEIIDLDDKERRHFWDYILEKQRQFYEDYIQLTIEINDVRKIKPKSLEEFKAIQDAISKKIDDFTLSNPAIALGEKFLDKILQPLHLEVDKNTFTINDIESANYSGKISLRHTQTKKILDEYEMWCTGAKQIISCMVPLYYLEPRKSIILFDEPERSLYPNLQSTIIKQYCNDKLVGDSQLFFATHSPIVASAFEPWEIIHLETDNDGIVKQRLFYNGERHINNYNTYPMYLSYDDTLSGGFQINADELNMYRNDLITQLQILKREVERLAEAEGDNSEKIERLINEMEIMAKKLNYKFTVI